MSTTTLILASTSPRRKEILEALGLNFVVRAVDVDESRLGGEAAHDMVSRLAMAKAGAARAQDAEIVVAADTAVVLDGEIFGKPTDEEDALRMLGKLSGRRHDVVSGVAVHAPDTIRHAVSTTKVQFRKIPTDEARRYWQTGEPCDKAGAYAIQGRGGLFVEAIMGSYSGVVGLPVFETARLLQAVGFDVMPGARSDA